MLASDLFDRFPLILKQLLLITEVTTIMNIRTAAAALLLAALCFVSLSRRRRASPGSCRSARSSRAWSASAARSSKAPS